MSLHTKNPRTSHDYAMLGIVGVPVLSLAALLMLCCLSWQANAARIEPVLVDRFSAERIAASSPLANYYDDQTSQEQTDRYRRLELAAGSLTSEFNELSRIVDGEEIQWSTELEQAITKHTAEFATESQHLIKAFDEIDFSAPAIWEPIEFDQDGRQYYPSRYSTDLDELLRLNFEAAIWSEDGEQAIAHLARHRSLYSAYSVSAAGGIGSWHLMWGQRMYRQVTKAVERELWNIDQLKRVDALLAPVIDVPASWRVAIETEQLRRVGWMKNGRVNEEYDPALRLFHFAPSSRLKWLSNVEDLHSVATNDAMRLNDRLYEEKSEREPTWNAIDTLLQFPLPMASENVDRDPWWSFRRFANELEVHETLRRLVRTAAALVRFKDKFGDYPKKVSELSSLNYPRSELQAIFGNEFMVTEEGGVKRLGFSVAGQNNRWKQLVHQGSNRRSFVIQLP